MARIRIKRALAGAAGRFAPLPLSLFKPEVTGLVANHIDGSILHLSDITIEPERVIRDFMPFEALRLGWDDPEDVNHDSNGRPYHPFRNAFVMGSDGLLQTKCLAVVAGTLVRLASRYPGSNVHYLMEEDLRRARVEDGVICGGIRLFQEKWLPKNPENQITVSYRMVGVGLVKSRI